MELWVLLTGHRGYPHSEMDKEVDQFCVRAHIYRCLSLFVGGLVLFCYILRWGIFSLTPSLFNLHMSRMRSQFLRVLSRSLGSVLSIVLVPFQRLGSAHA